jgi:hypothetical protein
MEKVKTERKNKATPRKVNKYNSATCKAELKRLEDGGQTASQHYAHVLQRLAVAQD